MAGTKFLTVKWEVTHNKLLEKTKIILVVMN